ncbi:MAG TPA: hypothetical protein VHT75_07610 [Acidimicrobiales bacterium]|nr:hypothetical protein [Acidimicrobiales bacterium]
MSDPITARLATDGLTAEGLAYRARALAQAHPLSALAKRYQDWASADQGSSQPMPEVGIWAATALLAGYCVRRVEEEDLGLGLAQETGADMTIEELDSAAGRIAAELRRGRADGPSTLVLGHRNQADEDRLIRALDRIVTSEVSNRLDHWREAVDDAAWRELEEYVTWWLVQGYAVRVAEIAAGTVAR